ncbi:hypothetical protein PC9H_000241 [Pleurotus ostreatus]|uniref:Uncharacterized protein n=1 Tax=Pleurotus ostreatus TaxID=5322 RepID=A0A8H7A3T1_PLEOS|nr:uncharacterized protein PC9H_000241 [Pleurotus ostreatus]KAF7439904.1 hypothetical protein PC9H_000241 [Pleurotus ostreatus]
MTTGIEASIANVLARIAETGEYRMKFTAFQARLSEQEQIKQANAYSESQFTSTLRRDFTTPYASTALGESCLAFRIPNYTGHADGGYACNTCGHSSMYHQHHRAKCVTTLKEERSSDKLAKERFLAAETEKDKLEILHIKISENIKAMEADIRNEHIRALQQKKAVVESAEKSKRSK